MSEYSDSIGDSVREPESRLDDVSGGDRWSKWQRILLLLLFFIIYQVTEIVFLAVTLFQAVCFLLTGERNQRLNEFSTLLTDYMYLVLKYVCLRSCDNPWPLDKSGDTREIYQD